MKKISDFTIMKLAVLFLATIFAFACSKSKDNDPDDGDDNVVATQNDMGSDIKIRFLHHSTGKHIWDGGLESWIKTYNTENNKNYQISETYFPKQEPYGWKNYPYDYWNIWVKNAGNSAYKTEPTLEILTKDYDIIMWKHCFPVCDIINDDGAASISSDQKTIANYKLQYNALKEKMKSFANTRFIVWTGAVKVKMPEDRAKRAKEFFEWVVNEWDEEGDNIYIWDFYKLETEGTLYLKPEYASKPSDSHPSAAFAKSVTPKLGQRIVNVIQGKGDAK